MSVDATIGLPGAGKSYSAVENVILKELKKKNPKKIHTNLPLKLSYMQMIHDVDISLVTVWEDSAQFAETFSMENLEKDQHAGQIHDGCLVVWDEIQDFVPVIHKKNPVIEGAQDWIAKHRHYGCDLHWMSQAYESVNVEFRRRTTSFYQVVSLEKRPFGQGKFKRTLYGKDNQTHEPHWKLPFREETVTIEQRIYLCYKSFDISGSGGLASNGFEIPTFLKKYIIIIILILLAMAGAAYYGITRIDPMFFQKKQNKIANPNSTEITQKLKENKGAIQTVYQNDTVSVDGLVCVDLSCDIYGGGYYIGTITNKDTATQKSLRWNVENKSNGNTGESN